MSFPYYRFFPGDYDRDTRHLSMLQHGAYRLLIDAYMAHGPLPNDLQRLYRLCSAFNSEERLAIESVLGEFFRLDETAWRHKRCDAEMDWQKEKSESAKQSIAIRWHKERTTNVVRTKNVRYTNQNQNQNQNQNHKPEDVVVSIPLADGTEYHIFNGLLEELDRLYPGIESTGTLKQIRGWALGNPTRRKTRSGILRHIHAWFSKEQNRVS